MTTILDFVNDKFKTVRSVSKLKNKLQRRTYIDNPNVPYLDNFVVYEPLKEKTQYEKSVEYIREGSISETNSRSQIPYKFWYGVII